MSVIKVMKRTPTKIVEWVDAGLETTRIRFEVGPHLWFDVQTDGESLRVRCLESVVLQQQSTNDVTIRVDDKD